VQIELLHGAFLNRHALGAVRLARNSLTCVAHPTRRASTSDKLLLRLQQGGIPSLIVPCAHLVCAHEPGFSSMTSTHDIAPHIGAEMADSGVKVTTDYPLELHYIKALFLRKQYRQCIQTCRDVLKSGGDAVLQQPLQQLFINVYLGLAHDELARMMHDCSQAKIPAFKQAEQFYRQALATLPAADKNSSKPDIQNTTDEKDSTIIIPASPPTTETLQHRDGDEGEDDHDPFNDSRSNFSPVASRTLTSTSPPSMNSNAENALLRSPQALSREASDTTMDSHSSFNQIMTPSRVAKRGISGMSLSRQESPQQLERDISRMSLLDNVPKPPVPPRSNLRPSLPKSTSVGLLRPIGPGSPLKAFHIPQAPSKAASTNRLPRLITRSTWDTPSHGISTAIEEEGPPSPVSPFSPEDAEFDDARSEDMTISPVSPQTANRDFEFSSPIISRVATPEPVHIATFQPPRIATPKPAPVDLDAKKEHIDAMRVQLGNHLRLLDQAVERTVNAQTAHGTERISLTPSVKSVASKGIECSSTARPDSALSRHDSIVSVESKRTTQVRTYWSFTPEDVKIVEMQNRRKRGRERKWVRDRFQPEKYVELAENALREL
jgi:hypothetical protein